MSKKLYFSILLLLYLVSLLDVYVPGLRYVKYLGVVLAILYWVRSDFGKLYVADFLYPFLFLWVWLTCFIWMANGYGVFDYIFITCYLVPFLVLNNPSFNAVKVFYLLLVFSVVVSVLALVKEGFYFSLLGSDSTFENGSFSFVFGFFAVFFLVEKKNAMFFLCVVLCFLTLKRVSLIALFFVFLLFNSPGFIRSLVRPWIMMFVNLAVVLSLYFVTTDSFNDLCVYVFDKTASYMTQGRNVLYGELFYLMSLDFDNYILGVGLGESYHAAAFSVDVDKKFNLHSDVLKIFYESGVFVFCVFFFLLYRCDERVKYLALYLNVILITDNVSTYAFVMFFYFVVAYAIRMSQASVKCCRRF